MPVVTTNSAALFSVRQLNMNARNQSLSLNKLASGSRIVTASDDAAGLAVSSSLKADIATLKQCTNNIKQMVSLLNIGDAALARQNDIYVRAQALATAACSGSVDDTSRSYMQVEFSQLAAEFDAISASTKYGTIQIPNYSGVTQVGIDPTDIFTVDLSGVWPGGFSSESVATVAQAQSAQGVFLGARFDISNTQAFIGGYISALETQGDIIDSSLESLSSATSSIVDADIGQEQSKFVLSQILSEAAIAAVAQANKMTKNLLNVTK